MDADDLKTTVFEEDVVCPQWSSDEKKYPASADGYDLQREVGHGGTATVWAARCRATGEFVAVKVFFLDHMKGDKGRAVQEVLTNRSLKHPSILPVLAHFQDGEEHVWMVTPFINGGSVSSIITHRHPQGLTEAAILGIAAPVLQALGFMHELSLMHRDVKAANVLVSMEGRVYLGDFGVVAPVQHVSGSSQSGGRERERLKARHEAVLSTFAGTPAWMAPEVVAPNEDTGYDERADIWSFGILLVEMAHGEAPYVDEPLESVVTAIANKDPPMLQADDDERVFSRDFRELVKTCLQKDPAARPSAKGLMTRKIFKAPIGDGKLVDELYGMPQEHSSKMRRIPSRSQSMGQKGLEAALKKEAAHALALLRKAMEADPDSPGKPKEGEKEDGGRHKRFHLLRKAPMSLRITQQDLAGCKGLVFGRAYRQGKVVKSSASGVGFAIARHVNEDGELWWSAPAFLNVVGSGFGLSVGTEELSFVLVLRDFEHLRNAAAAETVTRARLMSLQLLLGNGHHTSKIVTYADGRNVQIGVLGWNLGPDTEMNGQVYTTDDLEPGDILEGKVRPPPELDELYDELRSLELHTPPLRAASDLSLKDVRRGLDHSVHATEKTAQPSAEPEVHAHSVHGGSAMGTKLRTADGASTGRLHTS